MLVLMETGGGLTSFHTSFRMCMFEYLQETSFPSATRPISLLEYL